MAHAGLKTADSEVRMGQLFLAMAEELKLPLLQIARQAELQQLLTVSEPTAADMLTGNRLHSLQSIQTSADMTVQLLDSYLLSLRLHLRPESALALEPVSLAAVLHDTAHELREIAGQYGVALHLHVQGQFEPVLANRQALQSALIALGYAVIEALPAASGNRRSVQLAIHRTSHGVVTGVYGELDNLTPQLYRRARHLYGHSRQPFVGSMPGSGAGVFVAESILAAMESRLRVGRFMKLPGFAVTLPVSEQLQLI